MRAESFGCKLTLEEQTASPLGIASKTDGDAGPAANLNGSLGTTGPQPRSERPTAIDSHARASMTLDLPEAFGP
jgi:hypothetical protein